LSILEQTRTQRGIRDWDLELERAICLARLGEYIAANDILEQLDEERPDNPVVLDQRGVCLQAMHRLNEALDVYQRKLSIQEDLPGRQGLGRTLFALGKHDEAYHIFEKILEEQPEDFDAKWFIAEILQAKGNFDQAREVLKGIDPAELARRGREILRVENKIAELERRIVEQQVELERAQKLAYLGTMATATAHELNQPIGIIRAITDAAISDLRSNLFKPEEIQPVLEKILVQTDRLARIIENLRGFARSDRTKREPVSLNQVVQQVSQMFTEQFKHRNVDLFVSTKDQKLPPMAWANPVQIEEILINLLTNARDAVEGRPDAAVWISCWRLKGGGSRIVVEDNGPGLSIEYRKQIFTPFVSTKTTEKGTGLGLFISRQIVVDLGGRLYYEDRPDGGARFAVELPPMQGA
jgi:C4-dicarboxylate-specific signal transduction histidine kinase